MFHAKQHSKTNISLELELAFTNRRLLKHHVWEEARRHGLL